MLQRDSDLKAHQNCITGSRVTEILLTKMFNSETSSFQHFSSRIPILKKCWTSNFGKRGQNRPQNLVNEKGTDTQKHTRILRLLDQIGPLGQFDDKMVYLKNRRMVCSKKILHYRCFLCVFFLPHNLRIIW